MGKRIAISLVLAVGALPGCASGSASPVTVPSDAGLVAAQHPQCADTGVLVYHYLITGDPQGHPELDAQWAMQRAAIVKQPAELRGALARQQADGAIGLCDSSIALHDQIASQSAASQAAAASESARQLAVQQAEATRREAFSEACTALRGGQIMNGNCVVDYPGFAQQIVPLDRDGHLDSTRAYFAKLTCESVTTNWRYDITHGGSPWHFPPQYHADTGICTYSA